LQASTTDAIESDGIFNLVSTTISNLHSSGEKIIPTQQEQDTDDTDFQVVQHRKRIPSSTTHEKTATSSTITTKPALNTDIDLEPVILRGHSSASVHVSQIVPQTTDTTSKKKQKKNKKQKQETILFDAPEPVIHLTHAQTAQEEQHPSPTIPNEAITMATSMHEDNQVLTSSTTDSEPTNVESSEKIETKEVDNQHQSSSSGLFELVKNLVPSAVLPNTPIETTLENVVRLEQNQTVENLVDDYSLSTTDSNQETSVSRSFYLSNVIYPSVLLKLQASTTDEKHVESIKESDVSNENVDYSGDSSQKKVPVTDLDFLPVTHQSPTNDQKQDEAKKKSSYPQLQVINDNYPWYTSYFSIADAEARFAELHKPLNLLNEQSPSVTKVDVQSDTTQNKEVQDGQDIDDTDFQVVQRRKRIPSSTTHEKATSSTTITTKPTFSTDIDLEPVILHGHPSAPVPILPIISQTTDTTSKEKQKKNKKQKKEIILFDAPEPTIQSEENTINNDTDLPNEKDALTTELTHDNNEILTLPLRNSEPISSRPPSQDDEKEPTANQTGLSLSITSQEDTTNIEEQLKPIDSSNVADDMKSLVATAISNMTSLLPTVTSTEETSTTTTDETQPISLSNEQPESSSTGLFGLMKNLLPSTLLSNTPIEASSENIPSEQHDKVDSLVDEISLSNKDTNQPTPVSR
jgi:hypothetical protein